MKKNLVLGLILTGLFTTSAYAGGCPEGKEGKTPFEPIKEKKGELSVKVYAITELKDEAIAADGWKFRYRTITFAPGAIAPLHSHDKRPETAFMKVGEVTVYETNCTAPYKMTEGVAYQSGKGDSHWVINETDHYAVMEVVDLVKEDTFPTK